MTDITKRIETLTQAANGTIPVAFVEPSNDRWVAILNINRQDKRQTKRSLHDTIDEAVNHILQEAKKTNQKRSLSIIIDDIPENAHDK